MIAIPRILRRSALACIFMMALACPAGAAELLGYVGPGAGLSMLGALFAVASVVLLALLGPVLYPIGLLRMWLRKRKETPPSRASL